MQMKNLLPFLLILKLFTGCSEKGHPQSEVLESFHELEKIEDQSFERLRFELSPFQLKDSLQFKFVVRDQLGRDWLFKAGTFYNSDGAVAVYRFYNWFGLGTPEIHYKTLSVNGEPVSGTLQRFLHSKGDFQYAHTFYSQYTPGMLEDLAKNHLMSWLLVNNHVHQGQFLLISDDGVRLNDIQRIDNGIEWRLIDVDRLAIDYESPLLWDVPSIGYSRFWRAYFRGAIGNSEENAKNAIKFDLEPVYEWARFVAGASDKEYAKIFDLGAKNEFRFYSNSAPQHYMNYAPELLQSAKPSEFVAKALRRKNSLPQDLRAFYQELGKITRTELKFGSADRAVADKILAFHRAKMADRKKDLEALESMGNRKEQNIIRIESSFKVWKLLLTEVGTLAQPDMESRLALLSNIKSKLIEMQAAEKNPEERKAIAAAMNNVSEIIRSKGRLNMKALGNLNRFFTPGWVSHLNAKFEKRQ